jgi:hypothetical protein
LSRLMHVRGVSDVRHTSTCGQVVGPETCPSEVEVIYIIIPQIVLKQEVKHYCLRSTNSLILFGIRKNCLISGRSLLLYQFTKWVTKLTNNYRGISLLSASCRILPNIFLSTLSPCIDEIIWLISVSCYVLDQLPSRFVCIRQILQEKWEYNETVH